MSEKDEVMSKNKASRPIPDAASLDRKDFVAASLDRKGFLEKVLKETNTSFGRTLDQAEEDVRSLRSKTGKAAGRKALGEKVNVNDVIAAVDKARQSYEQLVEMRNRMMDAYREILRKQLQ